jgi:hypothetical protein
MPFAAKQAHEVRQMADHLATVPTGGFVSYADLNTVIGADVRRQRHRLAAARRLVLSETGAYFDCRRGQGLRRLVAAEFPAIGAIARKHVRLTARRTRETMSRAINGFNDVEPEIKAQQYANEAIFGLIERLARDPVTSRLAQSATKPLPIADVAKVTLKLLGAG